MRRPTALPRDDNCVHFLFIGGLIMIRPSEACKLWSESAWRVIPSICGDGNCNIATLLSPAGFILKERRAETTSIMQDQIGQQFRPYLEFSVVVDQPHCSEFVHEVRDARARRADHFGQ